MMTWPYWLAWKHGVYLVRYRLGGAFKRAVYGWSAVDTWSFDRYLADIIAPALRHIAQNAHGYPLWILDEYPEFEDFDGVVSDEDALEAWKYWLIEKATWFEWYSRDDLGLHPEMDDEQKLNCIEFFDKQHTYFKETVLVDFCRHFDSLWD